MKNSPSKIKPSKKIYIFTIFLLLVAIGLFTLYQKHINEQLASHEALLNQYESRFAYYHFKDYKTKYNTIIDQYKSALDSKDLSLLKDYQKSLDILEMDVVNANTKKAEKKLKKLRKADTSHAYETELGRIEEIKTEIEQHMEAKHFTSVTPLLKEWTNILNNMSFVADNLSIYVNKIDTTNHPNLSLYLSIHDIDTNETPAYLQEDYLYLTEGKKALSVTSMEQLEDNERITFHILADIEQQTTSEDSNLLQKHIDDFFQLKDSDVEDSFSLLPLSPKRLYDTLIEALEHLNTLPTGIKCLVALTDTEDMESTHTWEEVVTLANQYQIPIFMIGVGKEVSPYILERISTRTNGTYRNIHDFTDLAEVLEKIYVKQKAMYKVEYVSELKKFPTKPYKLHIAYQHRLYGGECDYEYTLSKKAGN